jgi:membrane-bound metal-dependent hydrolase YbcI (DUF457 family)
MPSPIGHALAGIAVAWTADLITGERSETKSSGAGSSAAPAVNPFTLLCAGLAAAPDLDLAFPGAHRTVTHSIGAVLVVSVVAAVVAAARGSRPVVRVTLICAAAYGSHLLLDWLGVDRYPPRGIQALWPISREWYISGLDIFRQTARLRIFTHPVMLVNAKAIAQEIAILGPIVAAVWFVRERRGSGQYR